MTLYTVGTIKEIPNIRTYVAVDGGMSDNIRTSLYDAHYEALLANKADQPREMVATVAGKHCESGDIVVNDAPLQCPEVGRHPVRVRDRRVLPVDGEQLQQTGPSGRSVRQGRAVALGGPPGDVRRPHEVRSGVGGIGFFA